MARRQPVTLRYTPLPFAHHLKANSGCHTTFCHLHDIHCSGFEMGAKLWANGPHPAKLLKKGIRHTPIIEKRQWACDSYSFLWSLELDVPSPCLHQSHHSTQTKLWAITKRQETRDAHNLCCVEWKRLGDGTGKRNYAASIKNILIMAAIDCV